MSILGILVLGYMVAMIPISLFASRLVKGSSDYVLAGRRLPFYMALATVFATWLGSESILGASSEMAKGGFLFVLQDPFGAGLCLILIGLFFARKLYKENNLTIGDYFASRYNKNIATILSIVIAVTYFGWIAAQFVALGIVMQFVFGIPVTWGILVSALVVVVYTYIGGMWSVVLHDLVQTALIVLGLVVIFVDVVMQFGFSNIISATPPEFFRLAPAEHTGKEWLAFIAALMTIGLGSIPQQDVYQRAMSARSATVSMWAAIAGGFLYFTVVLIPLFLGLAARMLYPDIIASGDAQHLIPTLINDHSSVFVQVMFYGALLSAIMSTASGALLAPATLLAENVVRPFFPGIGDQRLLHFIKVSVIVVAAGAIMLAIDQGNIYDLVAGTYSITLVAAFVPLTAGLYWKKANALGAMLSILLGGLSWQYVEHFTSEAFIVPSIIVGLVASIIGMVLGVIIEHAVNARRPRQAFQVAETVLK